MLDALTLERRQTVGPLLTGATFVGALAVAALLAAAILVVAGVPAASLIDELIVQVFLTTDGLAQTTTAAIPLVFVGLSAALAFRLGFWNIGIEGQFWIGAILATAVATGDLGPEPVRLLPLLLAATLGGAAWIALPLYLKLRWSVSEVVATLMLSNIAYLLLQHVLFGALRDPAANFPVSANFDPAERLPGLGWGEVHAGLILAVLAVLACTVLIRATRLGFYAEVVGSAPSVAAAAGLPVAHTTALFVLLSGAMAGLAGGIVVAGTEHRLTQFVGLNMTFGGIVVAVLARLEPLAVVPAAFFMAGLAVAGATLKVFYGVSEGIVLLIQGITLLCILIAQFFATFRISLRHAAPAA
ncbi:MAG: ABC transporter permease [Geminicoccaceae bacterium]